MPKSNSLVRRSMAGTYLPVEPKPPPERPVGGKDGHSTRVARRSQRQNHLGDPHAAFQAHGFLPEIDEDDLVLRRDSRRRSCRGC